MSTVIYRDGIMAADSRAYSGGCAPIGSKRKIRNFGSWLAGVTSSKVGTSERLFDWLEELSHQNDGDFFETNWEAAAKQLSGDLGKFSVLLVANECCAYIFDDSTFPSGPLRAPYHAIGSGREYALGALENGASAVEALRIATKLDVWSDAPFDALKHDGHAWSIAK